MHAAFTWGMMAVFLMRSMRLGRLKYSASLARAASSLGKHIKGIQGSEEES